METTTKLWCVIGLILASSYSGGILFAVSEKIAATKVPQQPVTAKQTTAVTPVKPEGWRRTKHGWEHTSTWTNLLANASINELIAIQREREPQWVRVGFAKLRALPPLMVGVLQIAAIAAIVNVAQHHRQRAQS